MKKLSQRVLNEIFYSNINISEMNEIDIYNYINQIEENQKNQKKEDDSEFIKELIKRCLEK